MTEEPLDHVLRRWPAWSHRIERLVASNERFSEVCRDYQELASWIEANRGATTDRLETAIELLDSLAVEITRVLTGDENAGSSGKKRMRES